MGCAERSVLQWQKTFVLSAARRLCGQEEAYLYPPQGGSPVGAAPRPIYMPPRPEGTPGPGVPPPAYAQRPAYYTPGMQSYGQPELPEPISMGSYLGMSLLGMVPVIGLVFLLVWALDFLAARVIAWAVFFVLTFVLFLIMAVASPAFYY